MLVCNVSLRPARTAITATIAEAAAAVDLSSTIVAFDLLIDEPASALDTVDAYSGEIMLEAASASDTVDVAGGTIAASIVEAAFADDAVTLAASVYGASVDEAATADDAPDAASTGAAATRSAMLPGVFVNSDGTLRESNIDGVMVNL